MRPRNFVEQSCLNRRDFLRHTLRAGAAVSLAGLLLPTRLESQSPSTNGVASTPGKQGWAGLSPEDDQLLDEISERSFCFFLEQAHPFTGLVKDRCTVKSSHDGTVASMAATGFGLTALCIGDKRGYAPSSIIQERVATTLRFLWKKLPNHRGFFYHFADLNTGERVWDSEVSSVDTAILLCGVLSCREYFQVPEIKQLANSIFNRVDWTWLSEDTTLLPHGWSPEIGFLPFRWDLYSELMMMYLLGLGSFSHPLRAEAWHAWKRTTFEYDGIRYIGSFAPLFVHQYSQAWFDFRGKRDKYADYFQNSTLATDVHRRFCLELSNQFSDYSDDLWGITASDSDKGYVVWGGPPGVGPIDGTVVPSATGGSLPFLLEPTLRVLRTIRSQYPNAWTQYGFVDAFNPLKKWYDPDVIGIDTGITLLMAENVRSEFVWKNFMKAPEAQRGMDRAGFQTLNAE
jgi:hypothetical protein